MPDKDAPTLPVLDWEEVAGAPPRPRTSRGRLRGARPAILTGVVLAAVAAPFGVAATGDALREGVRNGTAQRETKIIASHDGAATRQSNTGRGLAAVYGCRRGSAECTRHVNLRGGPAATFVTRGNVPFSVDDNDGLVRNLNADKVDGLDAAQLRGQTGPQGPAGPAGPQGVPGPTASAAEHRDSGPVGIPASNTSTDSAMVRTTITTTTRSRLVANGTGELTAPISSSAQCELVLEQPPTFFSGPPMSRALTYEVAGGGGAHVALTGAAVVDAGTHRVGLHCVAPSGAPMFVAGDVTVVAAAA
jgi:hypothetical protein